MMYFRFIFLIFSSLLLSASSDTIKQNFEIIDSKKGVTKILFTANDSDLIEETDQYKFKVDDKLGLTMDKGHPQLPVYSTLFKINPDKIYDITYDVISSDIIEDIDLKVYEDITCST